MPANLVLIPAERVLVVAADVAELIKVILKVADHRDEFAEHQGVAICATFTGGWYVFGFEEFYYHCVAFSELNLTAQTEETLKNIFGINASTRAPVVRSGERTDKDAVVGDGSPTGLAGIWKALRKSDQHTENGGHREEAVKTMQGDALGELRLNAGQEDREMVSFNKRDAGLLSVVSPFRRTPHLEASVPTCPEVGERFVVEVYCDTTAAAPGETSEEISIPAPVSQNEFLILVVLLVESGLRVAGSSAQWLTLQRDEGRTARVQFDIVVEQAPMAASVTVKAIFYYRTLPCGSVTRLLGAEAVGQSAPPPGVLDVPAGVRLADFTVSVHRQPGSNGCYLVTVTSPHFTYEQFAEPELWDLGGPARAFVAAEFASFTTGRLEAAARLAALRGAGESLYDKTPQNFRDAYELLSTAGKLKTIRIVSDEPYIPWELMVPPATRQQKRAGIQRDPIGVAHAVGRWLSDKHLVAPASLRLERMLVVAPDYTGTELKLLSQSKAEADYLQQRFGAKVLTPSVYAQIVKQLGECPPQLIHFVGHGNSAEQAAEQCLYLEKAPVLRPEIVRGEIAFQQAFATATPLVFLNACEVGQQTLALGGPAGFVPTFIKLDASSVIAPLWSVRDSCAHEIALEIYNQAIPDDAPPVPVAEVLRQIRARAYRGETLGEDTYAAYCFYGDPYFVIETKPPQPVRAFLRQTQD